MIKSILKLAVFLVIGIVAYNYFLGDDAEKQQAREIVGQVGGVTKAGFGLLKGEYQKFRDGKYDEAIDKVGDLLEKAKQKGGEIVEDIKEWEEKREVWKKKKKELMEFIENNPEEVTEKEKKALEELKEEGEALEREGKKLQEKAEEKD